jgi:hypothetical protein
MQSETKPEVPATLPVQLQPPFTPASGQYVLLPKLQHKNKK